MIDFNVMAGTFNNGTVITVSDVMKLLDRANIEQAVISPPGLRDDSEENAWLYQQTRPHLDRLIPLAILNPKRAQVDDEYARIVQYGFNTIKFDAINHGYQPVACAEIDRLLTKIQQYHFVCVTTGLTTYGDPAQWLPYIRRYPQLNFVLLGMGAFDFGYGCVDYAAQFPNIYLETSLQYEIQIIKKAINVLCGRRILFGSGLPYHVAEVELIKIHSMQLYHEQQKQITQTNAQYLLNPSSSLMSDKM